MHPMAESLAQVYIKDFWAANHAIRWLGLEQELHLWLSSNTLLLGKIDGTGINSSNLPFFLENKTGSKNKARFREDEKKRWRMNPQALTYGVLLGGPQFNAKPYTNDSEINPLWEPVRTFTTRWAFKTDPPTTAFEWYTYTEAEISWWTDQLLEIADDIRRQRFYQLERSSARAKSEIHWPTNLYHCSAYSENYRCQFRDAGCWKLKFDYVPDGMTPRTESHLQIENDMKTQLDDLPMRNDVVILDATRVADWINCHELYRRLWEGDGLHRENEDLEIGKDFHLLISAHLDIIRQSQQKF